jgi:hypothetical protein
MLSAIHTNLRQAMPQIKVVHLKRSITLEESKKADQNLDASVIKHFHPDKPSQYYIKSNFYPDGPGGNYNGL